jgi:hypothetical protein
MTQFRSNRADLLLTIRPARVTGGGSAYESGSSVQFSNGEFSTADAKTIAFLRGHELFGLEQRGFWEDRASVSEPAPEPEGPKAR